MSILSEAEAMAETITVRSDSVNSSSVVKAPLPTNVNNRELEAQSQPAVVNDVKDTVNSFLDKIALAQSQGHEYIEITPEVFNHYMRGQKTPYFYYQNIRVYKYGEREAIETKESGMA